MNTLHEIIMNAFAAGYEQCMAEREPQQDMMSLRDAYAVFGKAWVKHSIEDGRLTVCRSGEAKNSKYLLSKAEIIKLKNAEKIRLVIKKFNS